LGQSRDGTGDIRYGNIIVGDAQIICSEGAANTMENLQEMGDTDTQWVGIFAFPGSADYTSGFEV
jgi:hypothetical protein